MLLSETPHTTGTVARQLEVSPDWIRVVLRILGIQPARDSTGRILLSPEDVERVRAHVLASRARRAARRSNGGV